MTIRVAIVGFGKIARDQHVPAIAADPRFELAAISTRSGDPGLGVPSFTDPADLYREMAGRLDAVVIATPPSVRHAIAAEAMEAGLAVLLEKPPAATLGEIEDLERRAHALGRCLYAGWHSQHAPAVAAAAEALRGSRVERLRISWLEDVRKWHPGQEWIWEPGGFGVFDPGINALSIATAILPMPLFVAEARLDVPANRQAPIAARLAFSGGDHAAEFDWRFEAGEQWTIRVDTADGRSVELRDGGARLFVDGAERPVAPHGEYPALYARFAELFETNRVEVDSEPLRIVADAFLIGRREAAEPFNWTRTS
ncbi:MAG: Gfo/Idh/MocA family protein [Allosphingosinicella sp.]|uniref:Gfo/Idh/MocA family protein n=1 Tax=Allosphingosinicella sp. TaxID=2823234 RepID=UPI003950DA7E